MSYFYDTQAFIMKYTLILCLTLIISPILSPAQNAPASAPSVGPLAPLRLGRLSDFRHLPPDAAAVFQINLPALTSKVSWQQLTGSIPFPQKNNSDRDLVTIVKDPARAGIDIGKDLFVTESDGNPHDSVTYISLFIHLTDSAKFGSFLRQLEPGIRIFTTPNKTYSAGKSHMGAVWDQHMAIITVAKPVNLTPPQAGIPHTPPKYMTLALQNSRAAFKGFDNSPYTSDAAFINGFSDDADIHMWAAQGRGFSMILSRLLHMNPAGGNEGLKAILGAKKEKSMTLTSVRFETGRITVSSSTPLPSDSASAFYAKFVGKPLNTDLIARLPKGNLLGMFNIHFDPSGIGEILYKYKTQSKIDSLLATKGLTIDPLLRAFKGDILVAVLQPDRTEDSSAQKERQPTFYVVLDIDDLASFKKLDDKLKILDRPAGSDDTTKMPLLSKLKAAYALQDNILVISSSKEKAEAYFNHPDKRNTDFVPAPIKDHPFSILIDFRTVAGFIQHMDKTPSKKNQQALHVLSALDQFTLAAGAVRDGRVTTYIELKMADPSQNSLLSLVKLMQPH